MDKITINDRGIEKEIRVTKDNLGFFEFKDKDGFTIDKKSEQELINEYASVTSHIENFELIKVNELSRLNNRKLEIETILGYAPNVEPVRTDIK